MKHSVRFFGLLLFFCMNCLVGKAQQKHFIYVQSEDQQPFAIILNGKVYSSSDYGYIIIPKLDNGDYNFTVSFPKNKFPEQTFSCTINKKDEGYFLKSSNNGWALENMQAQNTATSNTAGTTSQKNAFGEMLSDVVSDSTLTKNTPVGDTKTGIDETTAATAAAVALNNPAAITDSVTQLQKISESKLDTGTNMLFVDKTQTGTDTINVFIPSESANTSVATPNQTLAQNNEAYNLAHDSLAANSFQNNNPTTENTNQSSENITTTNNNQPAEAVASQSANETSNPFYKPEQNNKAENSTDAQTNPATTNDVSNTATGATKQDCVNMLSDGDMDKLKRKMFSQHSDDNMVQYAVKYASKKCITTDQVKTLGSLFSSDDGRYSLYDALYKYVYDSENYSILESQILDPYYKKRFAAMLR
jgi:hypothetical protein